LFGGFEPFLNDDFYVGESFLVGISAVGAAGKFGDVVVGVAGGPIERGRAFRLATVPPLRGRRAADGAEEKAGHSGRDDRIGILCRGCEIRCTCVRVWHG
jgi:hypothetical protein